MKILQINSVYGIGSTGRIAKNINEIIRKNGHTAVAAYGRGPVCSGKDIFRIGNKLDNVVHAVTTRVFHRHGFASIGATRYLMRCIKKANPDIIHLHNIHGYYVNIRLLFKYLSRSQKTVVWTLHDCWPFTGHCAHFDYIGCEKWKTVCFSCPQINKYPTSWFFDLSKRNYLDKKKLFMSLENLTIVTPSHWLADLVRCSFLGIYPVKVINNGIDLIKFTPKTETQISLLKKEMNIENKYIILGVASIWDERKGLSYLCQLSDRLADDFQIIVVGVSEKEIKRLPSQIIGIKRTNNMEELADFYSLADVFVNPTLEETFGLTNIEALACGTPVITFDTGGSPEAVDETCGIVVKKGSLEGLIEAIERMRKSPFSAEACRARAKMFDKNDKYAEYIQLYEDLLAKKS